MSDNLNNHWKIFNAKTVNEGEILEQDIYIEGGRIERIGDLSKLHKKAPEIDLKGRYLLPGMIDDQVHFREPGLTHKATIKTESMAAVAGGVTSFMEMPNTKPTTTTLEELQNKQQIAAKDSFANYSFFFGANNENLETIKRLPTEQIPGIKIFMGSSTGKMLVDDEMTLENIFKHAPTLIATHCEDDKIIKQNEKRIKEQFGEIIDFSLHPVIRDRKACLNSTKKAILLANKNLAPLHILHITTAEECQLFEQGNINNKLITAEACVHHLYFDSSDYESLKGLIKCNPAIKNKKDRQAIINALALDKIDVIATDHAPHTMEEKRNLYFDCPAGLPLLQESLPMALELVHSKHLTLSELVKKTAHSVADRFKIIERGYIREGYFADLVCIDYHSGYIVGREEPLSKCGWTPLKGRRLRSSIWATWVSGQLAWFNKKINPTKGLPLSFAFQR